MITIDTDATADVVLPFAREFLGDDTIIVTETTGLGRRFEVDNSMSLLRVELLRSTLAGRGNLVTVAMTA
jgi:hypothetical protein